MRWVFAVIVIAVGFVSGLAFGWLGVPHYVEPDNADEDRLRARAAEFYQAQKLFDFEKMIRLYTPARQLKHQDDLLNELAQNKGFYQGFAEEARQDHQRTADSIDPTQLQIEIDGNWAKTTGTGVLFSYGVETPFELDMLIWVKSGGDWWVCQREFAELAAYGNPPAAWRKLMEARGEDLTGGISYVDLE